MKSVHWIVTSFFLIPIFQAVSAPVRQITIDGNFDDWAGVPAYSDPVDDQHDTDHNMENDVPAYVDHPDVDLLEFKFSHDGENLYAYFRSRGEIGRTANQAIDGDDGRFYVIVTIDLDQDDETGYPLHEGGYYPTTRGYDMNMEAEFYNGEFNTGHYLLHGCLESTSSGPGFDALQMEQRMGLVSLVPGNYKCYTQWVWYDEPPGFEDEIVLPTGEAIYWVVDKGPIYPDSIVRIAVSPDGHEAELKAPFRGFMIDSTTGEPVVKLGNVLDVSFSLEASDEFAPGGEWASDTADPLQKYVLGSELAGSNGDRVGHAGDNNDDMKLDTGELMRMIQLYNLGEFSCNPEGEDGFSPGTAGDRTCTPHNGDYNLDWQLDLSEMLRAIQLYNKGGYRLCGDGDTPGDDGLCLPAE